MPLSSLNPLRTCLAWAGIVAGLLITTCFAAAEGRTTTQSETIGGKINRQENLIYDFGLIAFSSFITYPEPDFGLFNKFSKQHDKSSLFYRNVFKSYYPWLYEYVYRDQGEPRYVAINKWHQPIRIELGYPWNLDPRIPLPGTARISGKTFPRIDKAGKLIKTPHLADRSLGKISDEKRTVVKEAIQQLLPALTAVTKLPVSFVDQSGNSLDSTGNIRVILVEDTQHWQTIFKKGPNVTFPPIGGGDLQVDFRDQIERFYLPTAVHFTPYLKQQVDGFFISNWKNEIGMAFCFISSSHEVEVIRSLVSECLLRSLGLPDISTKNPSSLLGYQRKHLNDPGVSQLTDYDIEVAKMLYSANIIAGMSPNHAFRQLMNSEVESQP